MSEVAQKTQRPSGMSLSPIDAATIIEVDTEFYLESIKDDPVDLVTIRRKLLEKINKNLQMENEKRRPQKDQNGDIIAPGHPGKVSLIQGLTPSMIANVLLDRREIRVIDFVGDGRRETSLLGLYNAESGLWETDEVTIRAEIDHLAGGPTETTKRGAMETLRERAQLVEPTIDVRHIPMNNGVFDHTAQELLDFSPDFVFLTKCPVNYVPNAENPIITQPDGEPWDVETWIDELSDDEGVPELLWELISAAMRPGEHWDQAAFLHNEKGNNGKGSFVRLIQNLLGKAARASIPLHKFHKATNLTQLLWARVILTDENPVNSFDSDLSDFKAVITGDEIQYERKYKDPISLSWSGFVIQCVNDFPKSRDKSSSYLRRQLFIPFRKWFGGDGVERKYIKHDYLGRQEVLEYVAFRALSMMHTTLSNPPACAELLDEAKRENNPAEMFWHELSENFLWDMLPQAFLYDLFHAWHQKNYPSGKTINKPDFWKQILALLEGVDEWELATNSDGKPVAVRPGSKMDLPERLIEDYDVREWMNPAATNSNDWMRRCRPKQRASYKPALVRVAGATGRDAFDQMYPPRKHDDEPVVDTGSPWGD